jgi:hypothetical protein
LFFQPKQCFLSRKISQNSVSVCFSAQANRANNYNKEKGEERRERLELAVVARHVRSSRKLVNKVTSRKLVNKVNVTLSHVSFVV